MKQILLLLPTASYRNEAFLAAGKVLGVEIMTAADYCHQLAPSWGLAPLMALHFDRPAEAAQTVLKSLASRQQKPDAVLAVDDSGLELAALLAGQLALPGNPPAAVRRTRDKLAFRQLQRQHGFHCPGFQHLADSDDPLALLPEICFPAVVKARRLSASRGVIRVDTAEAYNSAVSWARDIQGKADRDARELGLIIEDFIPGSEHALEGILQHGKLTPLALFDKPDPLDGPYFEETIYVTPSRLPEKIQAEILAAVQNICRLTGLSTGPIHAEMRINAAGVWLLEVAARSIGGLCGRVLTHALGMPIEQLILQQALDLPPLPLAHAANGDGNGNGNGNTDASGVMMIPIPRRGIYRGVHNLEAALKTPGITDIRMVALPGQTLVPPPEGASYLGFIFSRAATPAAAEIALRTAQRLLAFDITPEHALKPLAAKR